MRSAQKTILFARETIGKVHTVHPIAAFNTERDAKAYGKLIATAYRALDVERVKVLFPEVRLTGEGKLSEGMKLSVKTVPYAPAPDAGADDMFEEVSAAAA